MTTATASPVDLTEVMPTASPLRAIPIGLLHPNPDNPRADLGDVDELAQSIRENGGRLLQPLVVVPAAIYRDTPAPTDADRFVVIAGHRRLAACQLLDLPDVDCIVRDDLVGPAAHIAMLVENLQRVDLTALEEAQAFDALQTLGLSQRDIAGRVGRNQSHISKRLGLLRLSDTGRDLLAAGTLTLDQAVDVAKMPETVQTSVLADIEKGPAYGGVDGVIRAAQAKLTELAERGKAIAGARESGVECLVVDDPNITMQAWRDLLAERNAVKLDNLRYDGTPAHVELPCHLVVIGSRKEWVRTADGYSERWAVPYCTDPDSHATDEAADADPGVDAAERAAERARWEAENAARSEHRERLDALHQRRLDFARTDSPASSRPAPSSTCCAPASSSASAASTCTTPASRSARPASCSTCPSTTASAPRPRRCWPSSTGSAVARTMPCAWPSPSGSSPTSRSSTACCCTATTRRPPPPRRTWNSSSTPAISPTSSRPSRTTCTRSSTTSTTSGSSTSRPPTMTSTVRATSRDLCRPVLGAPPASPPPRRRREHAVLVPARMGDGAAPGQPP